MPKPVLPRRAFMRGSLAAGPGLVAIGAPGLVHASQGATGDDGRPRPSLLTFYDSGTLNKRPVYSCEGLSAVHPNPLAINSPAAMPSIYLDGRHTYRCIVTDATGRIIDDVDPYLGVSSLGVMFTQTGAGAVPRTMQSRERERLSVFDFVPVALHTAILNGTSSEDVTAYLDVAIAEALRIGYAERTLEFPAGKYCVRQIRLRDRSFLTMLALGSVQIAGIDGSAGFIIGDDRFDEHSHSEAFTRNVRMSGGPWLVAPAPGQSYARGMKLQNIKDSVFENISVSGTYAPTGGDGHRKAVELELSFDNAFYNCTVDVPGPPVRGNKSYALWLGSDNTNNNRFYNYRSAGLGHAATGTVGVRVDSLGNAFYGGDISAVHTCFELNHARGFQAINVYHEAVGRIVDVIYASQGCVFMPSYVDIVSGGSGGAGTAYNLGGTGEIETVGFQIVGGVHKFTGRETVGIAKGANCYGLTYQPGMLSTALPEMAATGRDNGSGNARLFDAFELTAARLTFPDTPVPSTNPTTLDAYKEGTWTPAYRGGQLRGPGGKGSPVATYTRIGNKVWLSLRFALGATTEGSVQIITGLPFEISDDLQHGVSIGYQVNPRGLAFRLGKVGQETYIVPIDPADGTDRAPSQMAGSEFALEIVYTVKV